MSKEESNEKLWAQLMEKRDAQLSEFQGTLDGKRKLNQTVRKMIKLKPKLSGDIGPFNQSARDHYWPIAFMCNTDELKIDFCNENFKIYMEELDDEVGETLSYCLDSFQEDEGLSEEETERLRLMIIDWLHNIDASYQIKKMDNDLLSKFKIYAFNFCILDQIKMNVDPIYMANDLKKGIKELNDMVTSINSLIRKYLI
tara:strand:- start:328 stop:924 length:597 start_codon:yes stop_codon:yes gene_type:complete